MRKQDEALLDPEIREARDQMRHDLGFRPDTRMDVIILPSGVVFEECSSGVFVRVR